MIFNFVLCLYCVLVFAVKLYTVVGNYHSMCLVSSSFSESLHKKVVEAGCIKVILQLLKSDNTELQFWASSLLLNLAMSSDDARGRVIKDGGIGLLLEMAVKESEMPQITAQASKILVMLGFTGMFVMCVCK